MDFKQYYDEVCTGLSAEGYSRSPDMDEVRRSFVAGDTVDECVMDFEMVWGDPGDEDIE